MSKDTAAPTFALGDNTEIDEELKQVARDIAAVTWELKALNTVVIDLRGRVSYTDFVVICSGTSERHVNAISTRVDEGMREANRPPISTEGTEDGRWALLDYGDIIVHVFDQNARTDYDLERMWTEAPRLELEDAPSELYGHFETQQFE